MTCTIYILAPVVVTKKVAQILNSSHFVVYISFYFGLIIHFLNHRCKLNAVITRHSSKLAHVGQFQVPVEQHEPTEEERIAAEKEAERLRRQETPQKENGRA